MELKPIDEVKTEAEAREIAIDWQSWQGGNALSWGEVVDYYAYFLDLADKFPALKDEWIENGII